MNKTNIIVTLGPASCTKEMIKQMIQNGTRTFRFNLNYYDHKFCEDAINKIKDIDIELGTITSIMLDTVGPDIKTGRFINQKATFSEGIKIRIYNTEITGDETKFYIDYFDLINIKYNTTIKINNGKVILIVIDKGHDYLLCEVIQGGEIKDYSSVYIDESLKIPFLSNKDKEDIMFAHRMNVDFLALSLVSDSEDVLDVNDILIELGNDHMQVISKIEKKSAVDDIDDIIKVSDGIMLTRGDLGVELPIERIPRIQKMIINKCHYAGKISIIATEIMSSMEYSLVPTRAEVTDIANAVTDGTDVIMLSEETMRGRHPLETLQMMKKIIIETENDMDYNEIIERAERSIEKDTTGCLAYSVATLANSLSCKAIITPTITGFTAKKMSHFRSKAQILALSPNVNTVKSLNLYYGVYPIYIKEVKTLDETIEKSREISLKYIDLEEKDKIIITGGYPFKKTKHTNFIKIEEI